MYSCVDSQLKYNQVQVFDNDILILVSKMVDGASKLDEKLDGAPFAMFVIAALQL